jgi:hypothetical protein
MAIILNVLQCLHWHLPIKIGYAFHLYGSEVGEHTVQ